MFFFVKSSKIEREIYPQGAKVCNNGYLVWFPVVCYSFRARVSSTVYARTSIVPSLSVYSTCFCN